LKNMKEEVLFSERQRFDQWWLWLIMVAAGALSGFGLVQQLTDENTNNGDLSTSLLVGCVAVLLPSALLLLIRLDTVIKQDGLYVRFFPLHLRFKHFSWASIGQIQVRQYSPLAEYGGWGIRFGMNAGKAYNISGNQGIQLLLNNGSKLLIGTKRPEEVKQVLEKLSR
jgi:hypothetical protein